MKAPRRFASARSLRLLLVEQSLADAELARKGLAEELDSPLEILHVTRLSDAIDALEQSRVDAAVVDLNLPDSTGIETLRRLRDSGRNLAIFVLAGKATEDLRRMAIEEGAVDFLPKSELASPLFARTFVHALERRRAEQNQRQMESLLSANPDAVVVTDADGVVVLVNEAAVAIFGRPREDFVGADLGMQFEAGAASEITVDRQGQPRTAELRAVRCEWDHKPAFLLSIRDITEQKRLNEQLRQAQKMEMVGRLAGGIAHDFNNLLQAIGLNAYLVHRSLDESDARRADMQEIIDSVERGEALTGQLLEFAGRQPVDARVVDLNSVVDGAHSLLRRTLPATIEMVAERCPQLWPVLADPGKLEQVLLNLAVNARDAMPDGGRFTIATENIVVAEQRGPLAAGDYVMVRVSDTGCGIKPEYLDRIFDPFFTTKAFGRGTGLGLATSYGILRQAGGDFLVESAEGAGTTFTIVLPRTSQVVGDDASSLDRREPQKGAETILLVEDDPAVLRSTSRILRESGYSVVEAVNGTDARAVIAHRQPIDFVVTDVVMPGGGGRGLAEHLAVDYPRMKILFITGQTDDHLINNGFGKDNDKRRVLRKPFLPHKLLGAIREMLDA
jgi:signal transduction histidine kinase